jgi:5-methylcytosine-specific restriction protein A
MDKWRAPEAAEYRKLYKLKMWRTLRERALLRDAFTCQHKGCGVSLKRGRSDPRSAVVHHLKPHKGDHDLFFDINNLQSLCWTCHSGAIQSIEARGFDVTIGEDGWPIDPEHVVNK